MPTCQVELAPVSKEMEILHSSGVQEWLSPVFIDCSSVIPFTEWLKEGASLPFRKWKPPTPPKWRRCIWPGGQMITHTTFREYFPKRRLLLPQAQHGPWFPDLFWSGKDKTSPFANYTFCKKLITKQYHIFLRTSNDLNLDGHPRPGSEKKHSLKELIFREIICKCIEYLRIFRI